MIVTTSGQAEGKTIVRTMVMQNATEVLAYRTALVE